MRDVMTIDHLPEYLQIPKSTLHWLVQDGKVPGKKVGRQRRFHREAVDAWLAEGPDFRTATGQTGGAEVTASRTDAELVGALAFTIVRAGARDGMGWWDDEALTEAGTYALAKIFPRNIARIATRLAFRAARVRHAGVISAASVNDATTLLDLVEGEPADLGDTRVLTGAPIGSPEELRERLVALNPEVASFSLPTPTAEGLLDMSRFLPGSTVRQATILAVGYLAAGRGHPVFPFLRVTAAGRS